MTTLAFVGLSHLGLNYAAAASERGFTVCCYDPDRAVISKARAFELDYSEPGLRDTLIKNKDKISFSYDSNDLKNCDIIYISKDVPTDDAGNSDLREIKDLIDVAKNIAKKEACLVILCQVPPGFTRSIEYPKDRLFYHVETLIFGQALERALNPERLIVGAEHPDRELPKKFANYLHSFQGPVLPMRYESAELAKISINLFLVSSVVTTNVIAEICEKIGADWFEIQGALKLDKRIGPYAYLNPGLGLAGGNLERDLNTASKLSYEYGTKNEIVPHWQKDSSYRRDWVLRLLFKTVFLKYPGASIGVLGLSYKENTNSLKNSPAVYLLKSLQNMNAKAFDPVVKEIPYKGIKVSNTLQETLDSDIIIIMTPWDEFKVIPTHKLSRVKVLIDPFNCFRDKENQFKGEYYSIGRNKNAATAA